MTAVVVVSLDQHLVRFGPPTIICSSLFVLFSPLLGIAVLVASPNQHLLVLTVVLG